MLGVVCDSYIRMFRFCCDVLWRVVFGCVCGCCVMLLYCGVCWLGCVFVGLLCLFCACMWSCVCVCVCFVVVCVVWVVALLCWCGVVW